MAKRLSYYASAARPGVGMLTVFCLCFVPGCKSPSGDSRGEKRDPHVVEGGPDLRENRELISPPILSQPIYACTKGVSVSGFIPGARIDIFVEGNPTSIGGGVSYLSWGQPFDVSITFSVGQRVYAVQSVGGVQSHRSNVVPVTSHRDDFPAELPQPRIPSLPLYECGRAVGFADVLPGAWLKVFAENPRPAGGFDPPVEIGGTANAQLSLPYVFITALVRDARITLKSGICTDESPPSAVQTVAPPPPGRPPAPKLDPVYEGVNIVTIWGPGGPPNVPLNGATLDVMDNPAPGGGQVGGQPTPGGAGQQVFINPKAPAQAAGKNYQATQKLCDISDPSPPVGVTPCRDVPAAIIRQPFPGDVQIEVTQYIPGARITIFVNGQEVGDGGPPWVNMVDGAGNPRPLNEGEVVTVIQRIGDCPSRWRYVITVESTVAGTPVPTAGDWPMFRNSVLRDAQQRKLGPLADPYQVKKLRVRWEFPPPGVTSIAGTAIGGFRASPVVRGGRVYIGNGNGFLYALDENTGGVVWQYPRRGGQPLTSQFECNPSSFGIAASAALASIDRQDFVVFAAPDRRVGNGLGSGRLLALRADTGNEFWLSDEIAVLNGLTPGDSRERHEQTGYSSPLIFNNRVYIGIANHCDNPIQNGRVAAVNLVNGMIDGGFQYRSTSTRGGGVWSSVAGGLGSDVFATTGNVRSGNSGEPAINNGLSMLRLDGTTGNVLWKIQPVPFSMDNDPDWASGPTLMAASCGNLTVSTMKDGWTYAAFANGGALDWQFPPTGYPFTPADNTKHGDTRYLIPGAAWNDVFFTTTGGEIVGTDVKRGLTRLYALNVCGSSRNRVRWVADIPNTDPAPPLPPPNATDAERAAYDSYQGYQLGPPTVTKGIVFVGTAQGRLIALADPTVWPAAGSTCSNPDVSSGDCAANGYHLVPKPAVLLNVQLGGGSIMTEPALADGRVFVATSNGKVYMLEPGP